MSILVVDDDDNSRVMLTNLLEGSGFSVIHASDGKEAWEKVKLSRPELIITDILMPRMDGYSLCQKIKGDSGLKNIPVILYSATYVSKESMELAHSMGGTSFVVKPQHPKVLLAAIQQVMKEHSEGNFSSLQKTDEDLDKMHFKVLSDKLQERVDGLEKLNHALQEKNDELVEEWTQELVESEEKYRDLYDHSPELLLSVDGETERITECNETLLRVLGYTKEEVIGRVWFDLYHPNSVEPARSAFNRLLVTGEIRGIELQVIKKGGEKIDVMLDASRGINKTTGKKYTRSVWFDITERKKAEQALLDAKQALETANNRLQELDRLKTLFISSMSHEFRTPLNSIIGFTGILAMEMVGKLEPKQKDFLGRIKQSSIHLLALVNDIIDISKIEAGKFETFNSNFLLGTVIDEAVKQVETLRNEKGLELRVDVPDNIQVINDRKRVSQCILNYLGNAIKYTEKGWISISARQLDGNAEVVVEDTGIGVSEDDLPKLFRQFVRLDSPLRMKEMGTGLGLYLTKKMASEILGGTVGAESQLGVGSKFYLSIPTNRQSNKYGMKVGSPGESDENCINH
jgi:PAS domain S-box-containing protein